MTTTDNTTVEDEAAVDNTVSGSATTDESRGERWGGEGSFFRKKEITSLFSRLCPPPEVP